MEVLQQRKQELQRECARVAGGKAKHLVAQRDVLQTALETVVAAVCTFAEEAIARGAKDPARALRARAQLLRDLRLAPEEDLPLEPCESDNLSWVETHKDLMGVLAAFGGITGSATCAAVGSLDERACVQQAPAVNSAKLSATSTSASVSSKLQ